MLWSSFNPLDIIWRWLNSVIKFQTLKIKIEQFWILWKFYIQASLIFKNFKCLELFRINNSSKKLEWTECYVDGISLNPKSGNWWWQKFCVRQLRQLVMLCCSFLSLQFGNLFLNQQVDDSIQSTDFHNKSWKIDSLCSVTTTSWQNCWLSKPWFNNLIEGKTKSDLQNDFN